MIWLKGCPKCKGELSDNKDAFGYYIYCVQCGYQLSEVQIGKLWTYTLNRSGKKPPVKAGALTAAGNKVA